MYFAPFADWGYDVYGSFLIAKDTTLANDPGATKHLAEATRKAVEYSVAHPEETTRIMVKHNPALDYGTTLAQWRQTIKSIEMPYVNKNGYGLATDDRLQRTVDLVKTAMKLDASLAPKDIYVPALRAHAAAGGDLPRAADDFCSPKAMRSRVVTSSAPNGSSRISGGFAVKSVIMPFLAAFNSIPKIGIR